MNRMNNYSEGETEMFDTNVIEDDEEQSET